MWSSSENIEGVHPKKPHFKNVMEITNMNLRKMLWYQMKPHMVSYKMVGEKDHQIKNKKFGPFDQILAKFSSLQL